MDSKVRESNLTSVLFSVAEFLRLIKFGSFFFFVYLRYLLYRERAISLLALLLRAQPPNNRFYSLTYSTHRHLRLIINYNYFFLIIYLAEFLLAN